MSSNNRKLKQYIIPVECYTNVVVHAENLEEAMNSLNRDTITDYRETFSEWFADRHGEIEILTDKGEDYICLDRIREEDYKNY